MKLALALAAALPSHAVGLIAARDRMAELQEGSTALVDGCGPAPSYPQAAPQNYEDSRTTFYNATSKQTESINFAYGTAVTFECRPGFSTDGAKGGNKTFQADCTAHGYFKPNGVCMKESKCGPVPNITHAAPTGRMVGNEVEFACSMGYSLDGKQVVNGGLGRNRFFELECIEFSGEYEAFEGECKAFAFVPANRTLWIYNKVTEALFVVSCKGTLQQAFGKGETPAGLDNVCSTFEDSSAACGALVTKIKSDFTAELQSREQHDSGAKKDWFEEKDADRPGIGEEALEFCMELWKLLEIPSL